MARKAMKMVDFRKLLTYISANHSFSKGGKKIKYVEPVIDMRTGDIFCVKFRGFNDKTFSITNENSDRDLEKWIYDWLNGVLVDEENGYYSAGGTWVENIPDDEQWHGS